MLDQLVQAARRLRKTPSPELLTSELLNENTFYGAFAKDLKNCHSELIIESPFITNRRLNQLLPQLEKLKARKVRIVINTRDPRSHDEGYHRDDAHSALSKLQHMGIHVAFTQNHHRKLAIIDRSIFYEGSLNILSQSNSAEMMRRIESTALAWEMTRFINLDK